MVEDGEPVYHYDTTEAGAAEERLDVAHFAYDAEAFTERWRREH